MKKFASNNSAVALVENMPVDLDDPITVGARQAIRLLAVIFSAKVILILLRAEGNIYRLSRCFGTAMVAKLACVSVLLALRVCFGHSTSV